MLRSIGKKFIKSIGIIIIAAVAAVIILTLCFMLPVNENNLAPTWEIFTQEGPYPMMPYLQNGYYFGSHLPGVLDNVTDNVMIETALDTIWQGNALERAMNMHSEYMGDYSYYWHGYTCILRPLFLLFEYAEIRVINGILQVLAVCLLAGLLQKKLGSKYSALLFCSYFLLMPMALGVSLQYSWVFYIGTLASIIFLRHQDFFEKGEKIYYSFLGIGILTCFFDLLTYPLFTWGFPLIWWTLVSQKDKTALEKLKTVVGTGLGWILGYGGMWIMKWNLGNIILGRNVWKEAVDEIFIRVGATEDMGNYSRMDAIWDNWQHYSYNVFMLVLLLWVAAYALNTLRKGCEWDYRYPALFLIGVAPIVWYLVLAEHTILHNIFTYRIFNIGILAFGGCTLVNIASKQRTTMKQKLRCVMEWAVEAVLAAVITVVLAQRMSLYMREVVFLWLTWLMIFIMIAPLLKFSVLYLAKYLKKR